MRLKKIATWLTRLFKPDKAFYTDLSEDLRKLGIMSTGAGIAGILLQTGSPALPLFWFGIIIWLSGLAVAAWARPSKHERPDTAIATKEGS
ncbi:hypothetical protein ACMHYO_12165 [Allopusillimonas ginsengisoli]|uniref:hypothetical protein n=1 Tax=Allopusillimonas ginsengisoli TaxID=453575 RepID=UPI0039C2EBA0